jgi:hypothetical protein
MSNYYTPESDRVKPPSLTRFLMVGVLTTCLVLVCGKALIERIKTMPERNRQQKPLMEFERSALFPTDTTRKKP